LLWRAAAAGRDDVFFLRGKIFSHERTRSSCLKKRNQAAPAHNVLEVPSDSAESAKRCSDAGGRYDGLPLLRNGAMAQSLKKLISSNAVLVLSKSR